MDGFPDPEEEYDLLHEDELEVLREFEKKSRSSQKLDFNSAEKPNLNGDEEDEYDEPTLIIDLPSTGKRRMSTDSLLELDYEPRQKPPPKRRKAEDEVVADSSEIYGVTSIKLPKWPFLTFNTCEGSRFYVKFRENTGEEDFIWTTPTNDGRSSDTYWNTKLQAEKLLEDCAKRKGIEFARDCRPHTEEESDLWVEKYKPKTYLDLLSDESVNRSLLNWLKLWNKMKANSIETRCEQKQNVKSGKFKKFNNSKGEDTDLHNADGRPYHKIALICGPPGLGKTTLAHVIASFAGYNVIEVNASDDRSIEAFHSKLDAATQMEAVFGSNKPNCLILDEIDGAPAASVDYLLKYVNGEVTEKGGSGKKKKLKISVRRPIICICNEVYTPSLRQLRQRAFLIHCPPVSSTKLAQRLMDICKKENIKTDLSTLTFLAEKTQNDIRCCLSTLQFFKSKNGCIFKLSDVAQTNVGEKNLQKNLFSMWQEIFQVPFKKKLSLTHSSSLVKEKPVGKEKFLYNEKNMERLKYVVELFNGYGDTEKLEQGVHENFLKMKFPKSMPSIVSATEWFCWSDLLDTHMRENQSYALSPYLPYAYAAWHLLFSTPGYAKISFPKAGYENQVRESRSRQILGDVLRGLQIDVRARARGLDLVLDVLPTFGAILAPPLRSINPCLFNEREKRDLRHLIDVMIDYNVNYVQKRDPDGSYRYQLEPNIEELTKFARAESGRAGLTYGTRQFLSREVEFERLRRTTRGAAAEAKPEGGEEPQQQPQPPPPVPAKKAAPGAGAAEPSGRNRKLPNHLRKLTPKELPADAVCPPLQYRDFFGRTVTAKASAALRGRSDRCDAISSRIQFVYKEGFSNAVRRSVTISHLL